MRTPAPAPTCTCGARLVVTLDALRRPRHRCPVCERVATAPHRRTLAHTAEEFARTSAFVTDGED